MELTVLSNGIFDSKTYIIADGGECAVIDCGVRDSDIIRAVREKGYSLKYIILTHGHIDHIYYAGAVSEASGAPICIHEEDLTVYQDSNKNGYSLFGYGNSLELAKPDRMLKHGDKLPLGNTILEIIHTPGHSPGSISILCESLLFSGDTLFALSVGRTDLYGGSSRMLTQSIRERLFVLDGQTVVYPGHGPSTSISYERENNPYV